MKGQARLDKYDAILILTAECMRARAFGCAAMHLSMPPSKGSTQGFEEAEEDCRVDAVAQCSWSYATAQRSSMLSTHCGS